MVSRSVIFTKALINNMWHILHYVGLKVLKHPLISPNELYGLSQSHGRFCYSSWHLYLVWGISGLHFLCWFNSFEGYYHTDFWKFLSKFSVTFVLKQCLLWCSISYHFCIALSIVVQAWRAIHFPWWKFCHIEMTDMKNEENFVSYCREACFQFSLVIKPSRCSWNKLYYLC